MKGLHRGPRFRQLWLKNRKRGPNSVGQEKRPGHAARVTLIAGLARAASVGIVAAMKLTGAGRSIQAHLSIVSVGTSLPCSGRLPLVNSIPALSSANCTGA